MKSNSAGLIISVLIALTKLMACHKEGDEFSGLQSLSLQVSTNYLRADTSSRLPLTITVLDKAGNPVNYPDSAIKVYADGILQPRIHPHNYPYTPHAYYTPPSSQTSIVSLQARWGPLVSEPISVTARSAQAYPLVRMPVIFHIAKSIDLKKAGKSLEDVIAGVNALYRDQKANTDPNHADSFIEFYLAANSPDGNRLMQPGFNQLDFDDPATNQASGAKADSVIAHWCIKEYVNVFVKINWGKGVNRAGISFSYIPAYPTKPYPGDVSCENLTKSRSAIMIYDETTLVSSVVAHEFGHMLGLDHIFGDCFWYDDEHVKDTPREEEAHPNGSNYKRTCKQVPFLATNVMDYYNTRFGFTIDQVAVMRAIVNYPAYLPIHPAGQPSGRIGSNERLPEIEVISCAR